MNKQEYINSQLALGKTHSEIIAEQPTELVQGSLLKAHYQELKTLLASGLRQHIDEYVAVTDLQKQAIYALRETFTEQYMADADFKVNFNVEKIQQLLALCVSVGALPAEYAQALQDLAKYEKQTYSITRDDFIGEWHELGESAAHQLTFKLKTATPEQTHILIQSRDIDGDWVGEWTHNTAHHGVQAARIYKFQIRNEGRQELRWRCEYALDVEVS